MPERIPKWYSLINGKVMIELPTIGEDDNRHKEEEISQQREFCDVSNGLPFERMSKTMDGYMDPRNTPMQQCDDSTLSTCHREKKRQDNPKKRKNQRSQNTEKQLGLRKLELRELPKAEHKDKQCENKAA